MSSGGYSGISNGTPGSQMTLEQLISDVTAMQNEDLIAEKLLSPDFFVGPNGKVLPAELKRWIGTNRRSDLLKRAENIYLKNAIKQLYRAGSFIGDGGTADVIRFEKETGLSLGRNGNSHTQKGRDMLRYIQKITSKNKLSINDVQLANELIEDLKEALGR